MEEPMFLGAGWNANVSAASDDGIRSRIALNETAVTSVSANEQGFRKAIFAAALAAEFSESPLSAGAKTAVATRSVTLVGEAAGDFANLQGRLGFVSKQVDEASTRLNLQSEHLSGLADDMAAVDPYEASTRLTALLSQIETSYALTARIQNLSFLRFMT